MVGRRVPMTKKSSICVKYTKKELSWRSAACGTVWKRRSFPDRTEKATSMTKQVKARMSCKDRINVRTAQGKRKLRGEAKSRVKSISLKEGN